LLGWINSGLKSPILISWNTLATIEDKANIELILPDKKTQKEIQNAAGQRKIEVSIDR